MPETSRSHRAHFCTLQIQPFKSVETIRGHSSLYSGRECGPEALDCSPRRMIAVSGAVNVVLSRAIEADNVVSETR